MTIIQKIKNSFVNATKGQESFKIVAWLWGGLFYFIALFVFDSLVKKFNYKFFVIFISVFCIIYALWHAYVTIKCFPKVPKLTKEEKEQEKIKKGGLLNSFGRKLFLQEPITKMNPRNVLVLSDLFIILHFIAYIY